MKMRFVFVLSTLMILLCVCSCEKIATESNYDMEGLSTLDKIPAEFGALISVTTDAKYSGWSQMWFADETGVIRMVRVNWYGKKMIDDVVTIARTEMIPEGGSE